MKIAISARGATPLSTVDESFGRSYWFLVYEEGTGEWDSLSNGVNRIREEGAGARAARMLVELGVTVVITGQCGPRVQRMLRDAGVETFQGDGLPVTEALALWRKDALPRIDVARCEGNPYCILACNRRQNDRGDHAQEKVQLGIIY